MGLKKHNPGCGCCSNPSACTSCCGEGSSQQIKAILPAELFSNGDFCVGCADVAEEVFLNNFTVLHPCDWLLVDVTNICGGASTSISYGFGLRTNGEGPDFPNPGECRARFRLGITCSGFVSYYDWAATITDGDNCGVLSLAYEGNLDDGICCFITGSPGNVLINMNP